MALTTSTPLTDQGIWLAPLADTGAARHEARIAQILRLSEALGTPLSVSYLDSCDVRELPVILARLQEQDSRSRRHRPWLLF